MTDFKVEEIGIPALRESLDAELQDIRLATAYMLRHKGHKFYVIHLYTRTWVYDFDEELWTEFLVGDGNWPGKFACDNNLGASYILGDTGLFLFRETITHDSVDTPIICDWTTDSLDFDSLNRKALTRLGVVGNIPLTGTLDIMWSDDDYATWSTPRELDLSKSRPMIVNCGIFRRRAFRFVYTDDTDLRLIGLETVFNIYTS